MDHPVDRKYESKCELLILQQCWYRNNQANLLRKMVKPVLKSDNYLLIKTGLVAQHAMESHVFKNQSTSKPENESKIDLLIFQQSWYRNDPANFLRKMVNSVYKTDKYLVSKKRRAAQRAFESQVFKKIDHR